MCGFIVYTGSNQWVKDCVLDNISLLDHRGGDGVGVKDLGEYGIMAHNLLSITGEPTIQPISRSHYDIVVNGEFYDTSHWGITGNMSDSILPLVMLDQMSLRFTPRYFNELNGEFAFVIFDSFKGTFTAVRDRFGIKPLYWAKVGDDVIFASEIKAFKGIIDFEFNDQEMTQCLSVQYESPTSTIFKGIHKVESGHFMQVRKGQNPKVQQYWIPNRQYEDRITPEQVKYVVSNAVRKRLDTDKKVGIALSGGLDSAIIGSIAKREEYDVNYYTVGFNGDNYNEVDDAYSVTDGKNHTIITPSDDDFVDNFEAAVIQSEGLSINNHLVSKYLLYKAMAEDGVKVNLSGEGSDEIFLGYPHFREQLGFVNTQSYLDGIMAGGIRKGELSSLTATGESKYGFIKTKLLTSNKMKTTLLNSEHSETNYKCPRPPSVPNDIEESAYVWSKLGLEGYILSTLGDKMEMASNIEGRIPFLDRDVAQLAFRVPLDKKIDGAGGEKWILSQAFRGIVPEKIRAKRKHPFISPPMLDNSRFKEMFFDIISSKDMEFLIDSKKVSGIITDINEKQITGYDPIAMLLCSIYFIKKGYMQNV